MATLASNCGQRNTAVPRFQQIIGDGAALRSVLEQVELVGPTDSTVLILGETGTGKELIARAVHNVSSRFGRSFVKLNCAAIPSGLLESELFGHEKGAFTGAVSQRIGRFEAANGGTLFLDEIGDIPLELQAKLLRVLQEQEFERLGSTTTRRVDVRIVAATNQDLAALVEEKLFRIDLYFRLNIFPIALPPLRQRVEDIPMLVRHFVEVYGARMSKKISHIPDEAMDTLKSYSWPGNIRELQNLIERTVILTQGDVLQIPKVFASVPTLTSKPQGTLAVTLLNQERKMIEAALEDCQGRISGPLGAAGKLGMPAKTLDAKVRRMGINKFQFKSAQA